MLCASNYYIIPKTFVQGTLLILKKFKNKYVYKNADEMFDLKIY